MPVTPLLFYPRPDAVEAVQVTLANIEDIAAWVSSVTDVPRTVAVLDARARSGDWVVRTGAVRWHLYHDDEFRAAYRPLVGS